MALRPGANSLQIGEWIADPTDDSLTRGAERLRLDPRAMQLLLRLARSPGEVVAQNTCSTTSGRRGG
jgi:DNA-binding winged helix-turn-helix (wHTH) protein